MILGIQYLRGLAALGVLFCHFGSSLAVFPVLSSIFNFGQTGVYLFFLISGFIIVYSLLKVDYKPKQFLRFLLKRSIRIDPPYIITILLTIGLFKALSLMPSFKGSPIPFIPQQFFAHVFYLVPFTKYEFYNHVFWTLCVEFQFYLLIGILYFINDSKIYKNCFLLVFACSCLIPWPSSYYLVFEYAPMFCLGISLINIYNKGNKYDYILPILFLLLVYYKSGPPVCALLLAGAIAIILTKVHVKVLFFLGNISYSLYLTHSLVLVIVAGLLKRLHVDQTSYQLFWLGLEALIAIFFAYCFYRAVEKPSLRWSKKIFYNKTPRK